MTDIAAIGPKELVIIIKTLRDVKHSGMPHIHKEIRFCASLDTYLTERLQMTSIYIYCIS